MQSPVVQMIKILLKKASDGCVAFWVCMMLGWLYAYWMADWKEAEALWLWRTDTHWYFRWLLRNSFVTSLNIAPFDVMSSVLSRNKKQNTEQEGKYMNKQYWPRNVGYIKICGERSILHLCKSSKSPNVKYITLQVKVFVCNVK